MLGSMTSSAAVQHGYSHTTRAIELSLYKLCVKNLHFFARALTLGLGCGTWCSGPLLRFFFISISTNLFRSLYPKPQYIPVSPIHP